MLQTCVSSHRVLCYFLFPVKVNEAIMFRKIKELCPFFSVDLSSSVSVSWSVWFRKTCSGVSGRYSESRDLRQYQQGPDRRPVETQTYLLLSFSPTEAPQVPHVSHLCVHGCVWPTLRFGGMRWHWRGGQLVLWRQGGQREAVSIVLCICGYQSLLHGGLFVTDT